MILLLSSYWIEKKIEFFRQKNNFPQNIPDQISSDDNLLCNQTAISPGFDNEGIKRLPDNDDDDGIVVDDGVDAEDLT